MTQGFEGETTAAADDPAEDTIELELTPAQVLGLSEAANAAQTTARPVESAPGSPSSASPSSKPRLQAGGATRFRLWPLALAVAVAGITAASAWWWAEAQRTADRSPPAPAVTSPAPPRGTPPPAAPVEPQGPPVQVRNPFDATEVFEFPAGTGKTEAREAVTELLLQRARDRRSQRVGIKHAGGSRRPARGAADKNLGAPNPRGP